MTYSISASGGRGLYFLADDSVLDLAISFLESVHRHNPKLSLCMIPFSNKCDKIARLGTAFGFSFWQDKPVLEACDAISAKFHGRPEGYYRKLASWSGPFDEFVYIDVDTTVLCDLKLVFNILADFEFIVAWSSRRHSAEWVWKKSMYAVNTLTNDQIAFGANTGFIASRSDALNMCTMFRDSGRAAEFAPHMDLGSFEQALLNYFIVTSGKRYTSLIKLYVETRLPHIPLELDYRDVREVREGQVVATFSKRPPNPSLMVHWAGQRKGDALKHPLWLYYRQAGGRRVSVNG